jgi:RNA polymerase sigma-70 factor, ECF subfamily
MAARSQPSRNLVLERVFRARRGALERYVRRLGAQPDEAEEVVATAFLRAIQHDVPIGSDREWNSWLHTVCRNVWIVTCRRRRLRIVSDNGLVDLPSQQGAVDQVADTAAEATRILAAIALLPERQRAVIFLRELRGLSYEEIAATLGMTVTV